MLKSKICFSFFLTDVNFLGNLLRKKKLYIFFQNRSKKVTNILGKHILYEKSIFKNYY